MFKSEQTKLLTYKIPKEKAFDENVNRDWVVWAIELMELGYENINLYILANENEPFNHFELKSLTSNLLNELGLDYSNKDLCLKNYIFYLLKSSIDSPQMYLKTLTKLRDLNYQFDYPKDIYDFYLLSFAKEDLVNFDVQYYWGEATKTNIDNIIRAKFHEWIDIYKPI